MLELGELGMVCWGSGRATKGEWRKCNFLSNGTILCRPKPSQPVLITIFHTKKREADFDVSDIDYFFLRVSTPTIATAIMTATAEPMIVMV